MTHAADRDRSCGSVSSPTPGETYSPKVAGLCCTVFQITVSGGRIRYTSKSDRIPIAKRSFPNHTNDKQTTKVWARNHSANQGLYGARNHFSRHSVTVGSYDADGRRRRDALCAPGSAAEQGAKKNQTVQPTGKAKRRMNGRRNVFSYAIANFLFYTFKATWCQRRRPGPHYRKIRSHTH